MMSVGLTAFRGSQTSSSRSFKAFNTSEMVSYMAKFNQPPSSMPGDDV